MFRPFACLALVALATTAQAGTFRLRVDAADAQGHIATRYSYDRFGCSGANVAPAVHWDGAPAGTRSFALTVFDPDAPTGSGFWHWVVIDLPASAHGLAEGGRLPPPARAVRNDYGDKAWGGPCPPAGDPPHHYVFTVYALDVPALGVPADASPALTGFMLRSHVLGKAQQTLTFGR
ncbi:YbhB/YbcL family Raf kinase inhibitor-like protein [Fulvimonas yonginensis]|uniref:YbhB/YbcL family Raf kinase inhibitor-like protein n=1 Tax=Fulvimonas yonginensis TaxID=1495200 RepID=A0ABU8JDW3_9GAMM